MNDTTQTQAARGRGKPTTSRAKRPTRVSMSGARKRMHIPEEYKDPNFHYAWINDQNDLVNRAKRAGYEHVKADEMDMMSFDVDSGSGEGLVTINAGAGITAYLMKQPMEYHEEDLEELRQINRDRVSDIKKELNDGKDGKYGKVEIS
jgi:hypothetical protein